jgi:hypothetical protein
LTFGHELALVRSLNARSELAESSEFEYEVCPALERQVFRVYIQTSNGIYVSARERKQVFANGGLYAVDNPRRPSAPASPLDVAVGGLDSPSEQERGANRPAGAVSQGLWAGNIDDFEEMELWPDDDGS